MSQSYRPEIKLDQTAIDKFTDKFSFASLLILLVLPAMAYADLPDQIPIHFNFKGEADNYGSKIMIWLLPVIGTAIYALLNWLSKHPEKYNYPVELHEGNAHFQYQNSVRMMCVMNAVLTMTFAYLVYLTIQMAQGNRTDLGTWTLPILMGLILVPVGYFTWQAYRNR
ncbi:MAG: DUF1648 domain-containing protein [Saprospiraceae bacterium]